MSRQNWALSGCQASPSLREAINSWRCPARSPLRRGKLGEGMVTRDDQGLLEMGDANALQQRPLALLAQEDAKVGGLVFHPAGDIALAP